MFNKLRNISRVIVYIVVVSFALGAGFMGYGAFGGGEDPSPQEQEAADVLAEVDGEEISRQRYNEVLQNYAQQTANFTRAQMMEFRYSVVDSILEETIILQEAEELGIDPEVSPDEIDEVMNDILEQNDMDLDEFEEMLAQQNITLDQVQDSIRHSLRQQKMLEETVESIQADVEVEESEVEERYAEEYEEDEHDEDEKEQAMAEIRDNLKEEREEEALNEWLEERRAEADIVINDPILLGMSYFQDEDYTSAINTFEEALERSRDSAIYIYKARAYKELGEMEEAYSVLDRAQEAEPEDWELAYEYGEILVEAGEEERAIEKFEEASEYAGRNLMARYQLNMAFNQLGAEEQAQEEMNEFMDIQQEREDIAPEGVPTETDEMEEIDPDEVEIDPGEEDNIED